MIGGNVRRSWRMERNDRGGGSGGRSRVETRVRVGVGSVEGWIRMRYGRRRIGNVDDDLLWRWVLASDTAGRFVGEGEVL